MKEFPAAITALEGVKLIFGTFFILKFIPCFMKCTADCPGQLGHGSPGSVLALKQLPEF